MKVDILITARDQYGMTSASCMLVKMEAWRKHGIAKFWNGWWAYMLFARSLFEKGFKTCNFDFFCGRACCPSGEGNPQEHAI